MIVLLLLSFYEGNSVATAERLQGAFANPAALGVKTDWQCILGYNPSDTIWSAGMGLWGMGFTWTGNGDNSRWKLSAGQELWRQTLWLGTTWHPENGGLDYGILVRPHRYVSAGFVVRDAFRDERAFSGGIGLRPLWDRLTLFGDLDFKDSVTAWRTGAALEFLPGMILHGYYADDKTLSLGLDLSFGKTRLSGNGSAEMGADTLSPEFNEFQLEISGTPYPTLSVPQKKWLDVTVRGPYSEDGRAFLGSEPTFYEFVTMLDSAAHDPAISGMLVRLEGNPSAAQVEELHGIIKKARKQGKFVVFYADAMGIGQVWLASAGDRIVMPPSGEVAFPGLRGGSYYLKGTLDKLGLYADFERIKEYKTAAEPLMSDTMSTAQKEQYSAILDDIYNNLIDYLAEGRVMPPESVDALVDVGFFSAPKALSAGLVDTTAYEDELEDVVKGYAGGKVKLVKAERYFSRREIPRAWREDKPLIALIVAEGSIISGKGGVSLVGGKSMGKEVAEAMRKARKDKKVKAVVFRVNSGGGSALGSDLIWREVYLTAKEKPVIVSMGDVAGSGGYYISCAATRIIATPATITGSIGIITGKLVAKDLFGKMGVTKPMVTTGHKHVLIWDETRKFTDEERRFVQDMLQEGYDDFTRKVSEGRGITRDSVNAIGRGRIWSGITAKEIGLVDQLGGLTDAIELAKQEAKLKDAKVVFYHPRGSSFFSSLRNLGVALSGFQQKLGPTASYIEAIEEDELFYYLMEPVEIE